MLAGLDTGFFFALQEKHPVAVRVWQGQKSVTSVIVLYELNKLFLRGQFEGWPTIIDDISIAAEIRMLEKETALKASRIAHGTGKRDKVVPLSRAAAAVGADGLLIEVHHDPDRALSDGPQSITPDSFADLAAQLHGIAPIIGRGF